MDGKARPILLEPMAHALNPLGAGQVALLADSIPERGPKISRVDNRHILAVGQFWASQMEFARPVAALTANFVALKDGRTIPVEGAGYGRDPVRVAEQACGLDRSVEVVIQLLIAGRQTPPLRLGIPCDRRFDEEAVALDKVSQAPPSGAQDVLDFSLGLRDDPARWVSACLLVNHAPIPALDRVLETLGFEERLAVPLVAPGHGRHSYGS
jgi:hypothetical protein